MAEIKKKKIIWIVLVIVLLCLAFLIFYLRIKSITGNAIFFNEKKSEFIDYYVGAFNSSLIYFNECVAACPLLPNVKNSIVEDCIFTCKEKRDQTAFILFEDIKGKYSKEEIEEYLNSKKIKELNEEFDYLPNCFSNCGYIVLNKSCVVSCLYTI